MTDEEVLNELRSDSRLNRARRAFSSACGKIEQAQLQRQPASPVEVRRWEFDAVMEIAAIMSRALHPTLDVSFEWHVLPEMPDEHRSLAITTRYESDELGTDLRIGRRSGGLWYLEGVDDAFAEESKFGRRVAGWAYLAPLDLREIAMLSRRPIL